MPSWKPYNPPVADLAEILEPSHTALLVIDVQNDFAHPDGVMGASGVDLSTVDAAVINIDRLIEAARSAKVPVIFIHLETTPARDSRPATLRRERLGQPYNEERRVCRKGTWGAEWYHIAPMINELVLAKWRYSSFQDTEVDLQLKALGVDTLLITGLTTECCVETAVRDAFHKDFNVFLAEDACASYDPNLHEVAVRTMGIFHALIVSTQQAVDAWSTLERC